VCLRRSAELQGKVVKSVELPPFPQKKWFGSSSPQVIEERRRDLERWMAGTPARPRRSLSAHPLTQRGVCACVCLSVRAAAVQTQECLSDPAFLGFLEVPLPSPVARASGVTPADSSHAAGGAAGSGGAAAPAALMLDESVRFLSLSARVLSALVDG
jgi:hypothetical protein